MNEFLPDEIPALHAALNEASIPHAFGGAIALAYCGIPRDTHDVDINIFLHEDQGEQVLNVLASVFAIADRARAERQIRTMAQTHLRWGSVPVDLFFANTPFHDALATRSVDVDYMGTTISVMSAEDLIVCKVLFNRPKDWIDIENIFKVQRQKLDGSYLLEWLNEFYDPSDTPLQRVVALLRQYGGPGTTATG